MSDNPKCPYCEYAMKYYFDDNPMYPHGYYYCKRCGAHGPTAETQQDAYDGAMCTRPREMSAREVLFTRRLNDIIDKLQDQADIYNERAKELSKEEDGQVSQYTWAVSLRETYRRTIRTLEDLLCEAEKL